MKNNTLFVSLIIWFISCNSEPVKQSESGIKKTDTIIQHDFTFESKKDTIVKNGEQVHYHKNGKVEMRGMMKNNKRDGLWKSWYDNGFPWSETTFKDGKKEGRTTTWYGNGNKRYEGFFKDDKESGKWIFWKEDGTIMDFKTYE